MSTTVVNPAATETITFVNEKPQIPEATTDVRFEIKEVSRKVKTVDGEQTTAMYVLAPVALTVNGMEAICNGDLSKALKYFNAGYFAEQRTKASNELSGGSEEDKAFSRIVKTVKNLPMFSGKTEDEITETLRSNPGIMALFTK